MRIWVRLLDSKEKLNECLTDRRHVLVCDAVEFLKSVSGRLSRSFRVSLAGGDPELAPKESLLISSNFSRQQL